MAKRPIITARSALANDLVHSRSTGADNMWTDRVEKKYFIDSSLSHRWLCQCERKTNKVALVSTGKNN